MAAAAGAYGLWGLFPLLFKTVADIPALEVVAHRVIWAGLFAGLTVLMLGHWRRVRAIFFDPKALRVFVGSAAAVSFNWLVFVHAIASGQVLQSSMGYFIFPLVTVGLGVIFLGERMSRRQIIALVLVGLGVLIMIAGVGEVPWIALALAVSFSFYGLLRKVAPAGALEGLVAETLMLAPAALAWVAWLALTGQGHFGGGWPSSALLVLVGAATAAPLFLFAVAARRLRLATVGLMQFVNPTVQFAFAVWAFGEPFGAGHLASFAAIWCGLAVYAWPARGH